MPIQALVLSNSHINVRSFRCCDVTANTGLLIGSRVDTVAVNCLRNAMENDFPMVATTLPTFTSSHQGNGDVNLSVFSATSYGEPPSTCSSSPCATTPPESVSWRVIILFARHFADGSRFKLCSLSEDPVDNTNPIYPPSMPPLNLQCTWCFRLYSIAYLTL